MNRPSHWIIALFAVIGPALWIWGFTEGFGEGRDSAVAGPQRVRLMAPTTPPSDPVEIPLTGYVVDPLGMPIEGAFVRVLGHRSAGLTTSSGTFEVMVKVADPGRRIEVSARGFSTVVARCAPTDLDHLVVRLRPALPWEAPRELSSPGLVPSGEGFIHDADHRPLVGAVVAAIETGDLAVTDDIGRFRIPLGAPSVHLAAWHASGRAGEIGPVQSTQKGGLVSLGVTALGPGARIGGSIRMPDHAPADRAAVVLRRGRLVRRTRADENGAFAVDGLVAGEYVLEVLPHRGALGVRQSIRVDGSGQLESEIQLAAEVPHQIRLVDASHAPHALGYVVATDADERRSWARADEEGRATLRGLADREVRVEEVRAADHRVLTVRSVTREGDVTVVVAD